LTDFDQTFTTNGLFGKDECVKCWGQSRGGVKYASKCTFWPFSYHIGGGIIVDAVITTI